MIFLIFLQIMNLLRIVFCLIQVLVWTLNVSFHHCLLKLLITVRDALLYFLLIMIIILLLSKEHIRMGSLLEIIVILFELSHKNNALEYIITHHRMIVYDAFHIYTDILNRTFYI